MKLINNYEKEKDIFWMKKALLLASKAQKIGEIPVGAVLVLNSRIIGKGWNNSIKKNDPTAHAEILALRNAGRKINNYRLLNTVMYVTLEPCIMCIGAIIHARVYRLVFGVKQKTNNTTKTILNNKKIFLNHKIIVSNGALKDQCYNKISNFFLCRRNKLF